MPVFDFSGASDKKTGVQSECTYTTFQSNEKETSPEKPIMILDNSSRQWRRYETFRRGRISSVYDRETSCKQCTCRDC